MSIAGLALLSSALLTPPANPDYIETAWIVQPDSAQTGERAVRDGDYVVKHRLLPPSLVELREDATDAKSGKVLAKAGDQLFGLLTSGAPVFCVNSVPKQNAARTLLFGSGNLQRCLIDSDKDGRLDGSFNAGNAIAGLPNFMRKRPKKPGAVAGGAYVAVDPATDRQQYFVGVRYEGRAAIIGKGSVPTFSIRYGTEDNVGSLTYDEVPKDGAFPINMTILGARFAVLARDAETIQVKIDEAMPEQLFGVVVTTRYY